MPALFVEQPLTALEWVFHEQSTQEFQCTDCKHFTFVESMKGLISLAGLSDLLPGSVLSCVLERDFLFPSSLIGGEGITHTCVCTRVDSPTSAYLQGRSRTEESQLL